jgi:hypothetical protein
VEVELEVDIRSAAPPWEIGSLREDQARILATQEEGDLMGGPRFEQLFWATGSLRVGDVVHQLDGGGLRIRRTGIRRMATFRGHVWQSAIFPSGRGFGHCTYPLRTDGKATLDDGFLFEGDGKLIPARVVDAPWLRKLQPKGQDVSLVLDTDQGTTRIEGETVVSAFHIIPGSGGGFNLQQAIARYTWDGESANGMLERSSATDQVDRG